MFLFFKAEKQAILPIAFFVRSEGVAGALTALQTRSLRSESVRHPQTATAQTSSERRFALRTPVANHRPSVDLQQTHQLFVFLWSLLDLFSDKSA